METQTPFDETIANYATTDFSTTMNVTTAVPEEWADQLDFIPYNEIREKIHMIWKKNYLNNFSHVQPSDYENLFFKFKSEIIRIYAKRSEYSSLKKLYEFVVDQEINLIRQDPFHSYQPLTQQTAIDDFKENTNETNTTINLAKNMNNLTLLKQPSKSKDDLMNEFKKYTVSHLIRAHSKDGSSHDSTTPVNDIAFELETEPTGDLNASPKYTNFCATCGSNIVNVIDVSTGKVVKRFNEESMVNRSKEVFNCVAWTHINGNSYLVAAGLHGQVKVILPRFSICLAKIDAHNAPITCMLFHYKYPNILLTASSDHKIKIFKLSFKESIVDIEWESSSELLGVIEYCPMGKKESVYSMTFIPNDTLLIATDSTNYYVELSDKKLFKKSSKNTSEAVDTNVSNEEAILHMTSAPEKNLKWKVFEAQPLYIEGVSENNTVYEENIKCNKFIFLKNIIVANVVNSSLLYVLEPVYNSNDEIPFKLRKIRFVNVADDKVKEMNQLSYYEENGFIYVLRGSTNGVFYNIYGIESGFKSIVKFSLPNDYSIKYVNDTLSGGVKDYGLLEKPSVLKVVCNGNFVATITDQNIISVWRK